MLESQVQAKLALSRSQLSNIGNALIELSVSGEDGDGLVLNHTSENSMLLVGLHFEFVLDVNSDEETPVTGSYAIEEDNEGEEFLAA